MTRPDLRAEYERLRDDFGAALAAVGIAHNRVEPYHTEQVDTARAALDAFMERHLFGREPDGWVLLNEQGAPINYANTVLFGSRYIAVESAKGRWPVHPVYIGTAPVPEHTESANGE